MMTRVRIFSLLSTLGRRGSREQISLTELAMQRLEQRALLGGLDPFGDDVDRQAVAEGQDRADDLDVLRLARGAHERRVDLQRVDRKAMQVAERRVAGPEIVERD